MPRARNDVIADADALNAPEIAIFVSANAVRFGLDFAGDAKIAAIGPATAACLEESGRTVDIRARDGFDSERLLEVPAMRDVAGKVVRIIRGNGGRELLANVLRERGATVEYLSVYSREIPEYEPAELDALCGEWTRGNIDVVTVMSVETLINLAHLLPRECLDALPATPLVTPASRVIKEAKKRFPGIATMLADGPQASDMVEAVVACQTFRTPQ